MLLTVDQAAAELGGASVGFVRKLIRGGQLRAARLGRLVRVDPADLAKYVESSKSGGAPCSTVNESRDSGGSSSTTRASATASRLAATLRQQRQSRRAASGRRSSKKPALVVVRE